MFDWIIGLYKDHTTMILLLAYILPLWLNFFVYAQRVVEQYKTDIKARLVYEANMRGWQIKRGLKDAPYECQPFYAPTLKYGDIMGRLLGTVVPFVNVICCFRNFPAIFAWLGNIIQWIWEVLDHPLVAKRD